MNFSLTRFRNFIQQADASLMKVLEGKIPPTNYIQVYFFPFSLHMITSKTYINPYATLVLSRFVFRMYRIWYSCDTSYESIIL